MPRAFCFGPAFSLAQSPASSWKRSQYPLACQPSVAGVDLFDPAAHRLASGSVVRLSRSGPASFADSLRSSEFQTGTECDQLQLSKRFVEDCSSRHESLAIRPLGSQRDRLFVDRSSPPPAGLAASFYACSLLVAGALAAASSPPRPSCSPASSGTHRLRFGRLLGR